MEKNVFELVEESCLAFEKNDTKLVSDGKRALSVLMPFVSFQALEKAEEAMRNEKSLVRYREEQNLGESDLSSSGFVRVQSDREHQTNFFRWTV